MYSRNMKIIIILLLAVFGFLLMSAALYLVSLIPSLTDFVISIYQNPALIISPENLWLFVILMLAVSAGIFLLYKCFQVIYSHIKEQADEKKTVSNLDKERKSLGVIMEVAQKEFMKRRISKETFNDLQRMGGKKMVEIRAKRKEMTGSETPEPKKSEKKKK